MYKESLILLPKVSKSISKGDETKVRLIVSMGEAQLSQGKKNKLEKKIF